MIGIYKIISPSGKIYIGSSINILNRWKDYKHLSCKNQPKIYNSLKKYGVKNHIFEILEECPESYLDELETWWKLFYNSVEDGLNHEYWDIGGGPKSKETKLKISQNKERSLKIKNNRFKVIEKNSKIILQYDLEGNFIKEWKNQKEAKKYIGKGDINACLKNRTKKSGKYIWKYKVT